MKYFLAEKAVLKLIETPSVYHSGTDELYELDEDSFSFLKKASSENGASSEENEFIRYCLDEHILTTDRVLKKRPPLTESSEPSLRYLELQITDACNLRCRHCYIDSSESANGKTGTGRSELSLDRIKEVLREFDEMQGLRLLITGGEPLLYSRFDEINEMLPVFSFRKVLFTNGLLLTNDILRKLHADEIQISIDGLEDAHDLLRGKGTFLKAMSSVKNSMAAGFAVSVATMVHPANLGDFDKLERMFMDLGVRDWTVDVPCIEGRLRDNPDICISPELGGKLLGYGFGGGLHSGTAGFGCGLHLMAINAAGSAAKCTFYGDRAVGNIDEGLRECWQRIQPVRLDTLTCDCEHVETCRGGCRYRAEQFGNPLGRDLYKCFFYDIIKSDINPA